MIDLKDLNRAVCDLYRQALNAAGSAAEILPELVAEDVPSPIVRPSAKVELEDGTQARLLASGQEKTVTFREATAHGIITMNAEAFAAVESGTVKKGDVLGVARIAGIMATKRTSELIPLCHPLPLTKVSVDFKLLPERQAVEALCTVKTAGVTGVEMEALTGVSTALLTIYDMCKAVDKGMELGEIHLVEKTGGKSGHYIRAEGGYV